MFHHQLKQKGRRSEVKVPTVQVPAQLTVEHLMAAVKQLSPAELREFKRRFTQWQEQDSKQADEEAVLLACIEDNSRLPAAKQRRFNCLRSPLAVLGSSFLLGQYPYLVSIRSGESQTRFLHHLH
jgi:hypothetical protein